MEVASLAQIRRALAEAGVAESYNFAQFLGHLKDQPRGAGPVELGPGDLIAMDEASMFSSPDLADIVDYAARSGAKVVMALDHQQLQAVENGGGASLVTRTQGYVQLPEPVRFTEAVGTVGVTGAARRQDRGAGRLRRARADQGRDSGGNPGAAAQAYVAHTLEGKDSLLIARSHELRRELCRRVRDDLQHLGLVARDGPSIEIADGQRASIGDLHRLHRKRPLGGCWRGEHAGQHARAAHRGDHCPAARWSAGCWRPTRKPRRRAGPRKRSCSPATRRRAGIRGDRARRPGPDCGSHPDRRRPGR